MEISNNSDKLNYIQIEFRIIKPKSFFLATKGYYLELYQKEIVDTDFK